MKRIVTTALFGALVALAGASSPAAAQEHEAKQIDCFSVYGKRKSCPAGGEVLNAGILSVASETPCILGYTWGFEKNGIWTGNGCAGVFRITVVSAQQEAADQADPNRLRTRLQNTRQRLRDVRTELQQEREERQRIEAELSEAQAELAELTETRRKNTSRRDNWSVRSVSACGRKAVREAEKAGAEKAQVIEIVSARPSEGAWLVIGRVSANYGDDRRRSYFRCWADDGKVQSFDNTI